MNFLQPFALHSYQGTEAQELKEHTQTEWKSLKELQELRSKLMLTEVTDAVESTFAVGNSRTVFVSQLRVSVHVLLQ